MGHRKANDLVVVRSECVEMLPRLTGLGYITLSSKKPAIEWQLVMSGVALLESVKEFVFGPEPRPQLKNARWPITNSFSTSVFTCRWLISTINNTLWNVEHSTIKCDIEL
jgi:hypothetical protein